MMVQDDRGMSRVGFMQGRLSEPVNGRIQAFPRQHWRDEFTTAGKLGFNLMEWTLDHDDIFDNPLMSQAGRKEIRTLSEDFGVEVQSLTGDFVMQAPFYKLEGRQRQVEIDMLRRVLEACVEAGISVIVLPLVDDGRIDGQHHAAVLKQGLDEVLNGLEGRNLVVTFESDFAPEQLADFIATYPSKRFGINYDIGNSASLGFDPAEEIAAYGDRIANVHVKDRMKGGTTVPLGSGNADLPRVFRLLRQAGYRNDFILQTARANDGDHAGVLVSYREMVTSLWSEGA
jgi:L-ribulose-5-phosphate 3-epimerase